MTSRPVGCGFCLKRNTPLDEFDLPRTGELKFGQFQAPMGPDTVTSNRDITMMEPAGPLAALTAMKLEAFKR
jgi:hypothetical protein